MLPGPMLSALAAKSTKPYPFAGGAFQRTAAHKVAPGRVAFGALVGDKISNTVPLNENTIRFKCKARIKGINAVLVCEEQFLSQEVVVTWRSRL